MKYEHEICLLPPSFQLCAIILNANGYCDALDHYASILSSRTHEAEIVSHHVTFFPVQSRVILTNLTKAPQYNNRVGLVKSQPCALSRQRILLLPTQNQNGGKVLNAKMSNIKYDPTYIQDATKKAQEMVEKAKVVIENDPEVLTTYVDLDDFTYSMENDPVPCGFRDNFSELCPAGESLPIHWVVFLSNHSDMLKLILDHCPESAALPTIGHATRTSLQIATFMSNMQFTLAILEACPQAVHIKDDYGCLPIHSAVEGGNIEIIRTIADAYLDGLSHQNRDGITPLHAAIMLSPINIIMELLERNPSAAKIKDFHNNLPIQLIDRNRIISIQDIFKISKQSDYYGLFASDNEPNWEFRSPFLCLLQRILLEYPPVNLAPENEHQRDIIQRITSLKHLLQGLFDEAPAKEVYPHFLHDCVGNMQKGHLSAMLEYFPEILGFDYQTLTTDHQGRTPLVKAIHQASNPDNHQYWNEYYFYIIEVLFQFSCPNFLDLIGSDAINNLTYSNANTNNRFLLHIVAEEGLSWFGMKDIVARNVNAVTEYDQKKETELLPFMLAGGGKRNDLTSAFELLRMKPDVLLMFDLN